MTKIILCGCSGHMGHVVTEIAAADAEVEIVAGIDLSETKDASYPVFASLKDCDVKADALIDFSSPKALDAILTYCMEKNVPAVLCTTGYTDAQMEQIREAGKKDRCNEICEYVPRCKYAAEAAEGSSKDAGSGRL